MGCNDKRRSSRVCKKCDCRGYPARYSEPCIVVLEYFIVYVSTVQICEKLMTRCLAPDCRMGGVGCDNMTVIIVCLLRGEDYSELSNKCARLLTSASGNSFRERSTLEALNVDDDNDEWYDCADELLTMSVDNGPSCSINHNETAEVVEQETREEGEVRQRDEEVREQDVEVRQQDEEVRQRDEEVRQQDEEVRQRDEEVRQQDEEVRQQDEEVRYEEDETRQETDSSTKAHNIMNSEQVEDTMTLQSSSVDKEDSHNPLLFTNGHHDNQTKDTIQTNSLLDGQMYKSTAV